MAGEFGKTLETRQANTSFVREPLCRYLGKPVPNKPFPTSSNEDYGYDIEKATADIAFAAKLKQGAFFALVMGLAWYYNTTVWFVVSAVIRFLWKHGYVDPRGPDLDHEAFVAGG